MNLPKFEAEEPQTEAAISSVTRLDGKVEVNGEVFGVTFWEPQDRITVAERHQHRSGRPRARIDYRNGRYVVNLGEFTTAPMAEVATVEEAVAKACNLLMAQRPNDQEEFAPNPDLAEPVQNMQAYVATRAGEACCHREGGVPLSRVKIP